MKTYYQSSDGEIFYTEYAARAYAKGLENKKICVISKNPETKPEAKPDSKKESKKAK